MPEFKDQTLDELHQNLNRTKLRLEEADKFIKEMGEEAEKVGLSVTGAMLELNALIKQLFLCSVNNMPEYEVLRLDFLRHIRNLNLLVDTRFGKMKTSVPSSTETH